MRGTYRQCQRRLNVEYRVDLTRNQSNRPFQYREHRDRPVSLPLGALLLFPLRFCVDHVFDRMDSEMQRRTIFRSKQKLKKRLLTQIFSSSHTVKRSILWFIPILVHLQPGLLQLLRFGSCSSASCLQEHFTCLGPCE